MGLQCGIVGLPNVGKSTLFNCLSNAKAQSANFPFCTIEPNVGVITVPDERLNKLVEIDKPASVVPAVVEIVDIAGLVKGRAKARGWVINSCPTSGRRMPLFMYCVVLKTATLCMWTEVSTRCGIRRLSIPNCN